MAEESHCFTRDEGSISGSLARNRRVVHVLGPQKACAATQPLCGRGQSRCVNQGCCASFWSSKTRSTCVPPKVGALGSGKSVCMSQTIHGTGIVTYLRVTHTYIRVKHGNGVNVCNYSIHGPGFSLRSSVSSPTVFDTM